MAGHRIGPKYSIRHAAVACGVSISTMNRCTRDADGENQRAALALSVSSDEGNESDNPRCETRAMKPLNPDGFALDCIRSNLRILCCEGGPNTRQSSCSLQRNHRRFSRHEQN